MPRKAFIIGGVLGLVILLALIIRPWAPLADPRLELLAPGDVSGSGGSNLDGSRDSLIKDMQVEKLSPLNGIVHFRLGPLPNAYPALALSPSGRRLALKFSPPGHQVPAESDLILWIDVERGGGPPLLRAIPASQRLTPLARLDEETILAVEGSGREQNVAGRRCNFGEPPGRASDPPGS